MIRVVIFGLCVGLSSVVVRAEPGLVARYDDGKQTVETVAPVVAFGLGENDSVHPQVGTKFTAEYEGSLKVVRRGTYTFDAQGATLTIDGKPVAGPVELEGGEHTIDLKYRRKGGPARLELLWSSPEFLPEPVPASVLSHKDSDAAHKQALVEEGRTLVEELNCAGCHGGQGARRLKSFVGPDLSNVGGRANELWVYMWLRDPSKHGPIVSMPAVLEKDEDCRDVAAYLATLKDSRRREREYKASASKARHGKELFETIGCANCHADQLKGKLAAKWQSIGQLAEYLKDPTRVTRSGRMPGMNLNDDEAVSLANYLLESNETAIEGAMPKGADAKHGEQIFRTAGCLNCHSVGGAAGKPLAEARKFTPMEKLDPSKGCVAEQPSAGAARYVLTAEKRAAIAAFLSAIKTSPLVSSAPAHEFSRTLHKLNCVACHETEDSKPSEDIEKVPQLTAVGAKLKKDWINRVLHDRNARVRFWLKTRMPEFANAVDGVADLAVAAAGIDEGAEPKITRPSIAVIHEGQKLVGANDPKTNPQGMGCVTCHSLREFKPAVAADATRGPELTLMTTRLRSEYFHRWLHEPARIQPGTAMPNFFTDKPREEADRTIDTLWAYASLGESMPAPAGVKEKKNYVLIVTDTPLMARAQIPDPAGLIVYGVAVGFPEGINYAFDAQNVMFRTAWRGGFLDMGGDWDGRGGNPVKPLGQRFYSQATAPLRIGSVDGDASRTYEGYELKEKVPTFIYRVGDAEVRERITALPEGQGVGLVRTFEVEPHGKKVYYVASDDAKVTLTPSAGEFEPAEVNASFASPDKKPGKVLEIPSGEKVTFSVTIKANDAR
jgi:mono/diheme cytochrome c family protein